MEALHIEAVLNAIPPVIASDETDPNAWEGEDRDYVTEWDPSMQMLEDGDYPEDEDFEEGVA